MNNPKISVIVPVYNTQKYLQKCLNSILMQTFTDFELLLIDDGSKDGSSAICDEYASKDSRIRVFHKPNRGVSSARNMGLDNAKGEYVTFVDSDDWVELDMLVSMASYVKGNERVTVFCGVRVLSGAKCVGIHFEKDESFITVEEYVRHYGIRYSPWGMLLNREHIEKSSLRFNEGLVMSEDTVFNMHILQILVGTFIV